MVSKVKCVTQKRRCLSSLMAYGHLSTTTTFFCPRVAVVERLSSTLNILPESSRNELKYSLKIAFMFLAIILKFQVSDINILLGIRKKATVFDGPWSVSQVSSTKKRKNVIVSTRKRDFQNISGFFFRFLMQLS